MLAHFLAHNKNDPVIWRRFKTDIKAKRQLLAHAGIVGQVWRNPAIQARLATALRSVKVGIGTLGDGFVPIGY